MMSEMFKKKESSKVLSFMKLFLYTILFIENAWLS